MSEKIYQAGDLIFKKGDQADSLFQVLSGSVEVYAGDEDDRQELTELEAGKFFGEMGVVAGYPRSATVRAGEKGATLHEVSSGELSGWFREDPKRILELMKHLSARTREMTEEYNEACALRDELKQGGTAKNEGLLKRLGRLLGFGSQGKPSMETKLLPENKPLKEGFAKKVHSFPAGTVIFREGEKAGCMYGVHGGRVGIFTGYGTPEQQKITELFPNTFFGEMGMIDGEPRSATAVTLEADTTVEVISPEDLQEMFEKNPAKVWMIFEHLAGRLRSLTRDYAGVCEELSALRKA